MFALSFLVMIGLSLIIEGWDSEASHQLHLKNYIYFGMAFSFVVEVLNMTMRNRIKKRVVELNEPIMQEKWKKVILIWRNKKPGCKNRPGILSMKKFVTA